MDVGVIRGVGEKGIQYLNKLNLYTINDLLCYYPYKYNIIKVVDINSVNNDEVVTIRGTVDIEPKVSYINKSLNKMSFRVITGGKLVNVVIFNRAFYKMHLKLGRVINLIGKYDRVKNNFICNDIKFEIINGIKIEPVYHLINGIKRNTLSKLISECFKMRVDLEDYIPKYLLDKYNFMSKKDACYWMHFPSNFENLKQAKIRIIYEELFLFMFKMNYLKIRNDKYSNGLERKVNKNEVNNFITTLPFKLTEDQLKAVDDIYNDMISPKRMNRLVLGDVGSGKTCVAEIGIYINYLSGYQSSLMAPTEILARQHYENVVQMFKDTPIRIALLVGSMKKSLKNKIYKDLTEGKIDVLIGTHALISEGVRFNNLGLVITDEQHRFGVNQRSNLQNKGIMCDVLYLSATPIPRTYALTLYGDMDTSIIKTKPNGRKDIITRVIKKSNIKDMLFKILKEIKEGHQIYVVAPLIEDEDGNTNINTVNTLKEKLDMAFQKKVNIEILHGKMKNSDKDRVMQEFKDGKIKILISTTVIEVGVDVKNSTMMVIYDADRFGLATLHQLRGRVGRNDLQSYCYLVCDRDVERLKVMEESNDGFYISQKDFELRGEGDLFGTRQSGDMVFKVADIKRDYKILFQCRNDAQEFINSNIVDNFSSYPQYSGVIKELDFFD